jgi:hypothetical protein
MQNPKITLIVPHGYSFLTIGCTFHDTTQVALKFIARAGRGCLLLQGSIGNGTLRLAIVAFFGHNHGSFRLAIVAFFGHNWILRRVSAINLNLLVDL